MKLVAISDTHGLFKYEGVPHGDVLVHAGDLTMMGTFEQLHVELGRIAALPHKHKIVIAGNHDFLADKDPGLFKGIVPKGVTYLQDSSIAIDGVNFYGTPWVPNLSNWAFCTRNGGGGKKLYGRIPLDTDVLISHAPAFGIMDAVRAQSKYGNQVEENYGSPRLGDRILLLSQLKAHIFGHIHDSYGTKFLNGVYRVNAAICDELYFPANMPQVIDVYATS